MEKYCKSCGKSYSGEYCEHCGYGKEPQRAKAFDKYKSNRQIKAERQAAAEAAKKQGKTKMAPWQIAVIVGIFVLAAGIVLWSLWRDGVIGIGDKTEPIIAYFESIAENDYDKYVSTMPEDIAKTYDSYMQQNGLSKDNFIRESYSDYYSILGESFTVSVNCGTEQRLVDSYVADEQEIYEQNYGKSIKIREEYLIPVEVTFNGNSVSEQYYYDVYVVRVGFDWFIIDIVDYYEAE